MRMSGIAEIKHGHLTIRLRISDAGTSSRVLRGPWRDTQVSDEQGDRRRMTDSTRMSASGSFGRSESSGRQKNGHRFTRWTRELIH